MSEQMECNTNSEGILITVVTGLHKLLCLLKGI